ncbi:mitochondrial ATPase inhibitor, IATP-domain-containing protein [Peziza echinospora]|nr:mitochondrial ATPase inhibitor, IATP-domain-containing protein [Peziza echinospora]
MLRTSILRTVRAQKAVTPLFQNSVRYVSGEGATGSGFSRPSAGATTSQDSFTKREKAAEDYYIRQKEKEKLLELKEKLKQQRAHLDELDAHIEELTRNQTEPEQK